MEFQKFPPPPLQLKPPQLSQSCNFCNFLEHSYEIVFSPMLVLCQILQCTAHQSSGPRQGALQSSVLSPSYQSVDLFNIQIWIRDSKFPAKHSGKLSLRGQCGIYTGSVWDPCLVLGEMNIRFVLIFDIYICVIWRFAKSGISVCCECRHNSMQI